jgi:hypothetical protein
MARTATICLLLSLLCTFGTPPVLAGESGLSVPTTLSYQGYLADASGEAVSGGFPMSFALYGQAAGGSPVWQEMHPAVTVLGGFFQVELGVETPLELSLFDGPLFLGISIGADPEITPRTVVASLPFARRAEGLLSCAFGETNCFGLCANLQSDATNCGVCGFICPDGENCFGGECSDATCDDEIKNGNETDVDCGGPNCNACDDGRMCLIDSDCLLNSCFEGFCQCQTGQTNCSGTCRDLMTDPNNCGTCGLGCAGGQTCVDGSCVSGSSR